MSGMFGARGQGNLQRGDSSGQRGGRFGFEPSRGRLNSQSSRGNSESSTHTGIGLKYKNPEKPEALIERVRKTRGYDIDRLVWRAEIDCPNLVKESLWDIGLIQAQKLFETCSVSLAYPVLEPTEPDAEVEEQLAANSTSLTKKLA